MPAVDLVGRIALGIALAALVAVHLLRWIPATPNLRLVRAVRIVGLLPALLTAIGTIVADLVLSVPVLFASLPDGPPVGLGVGVSLLLLGSVVGIEPRAHEGYLPQERARSWSRRLLGGVAGAAALALVVALVMIVGRVFTTGWQYSLNTFGSTVISVVLLGIVLGSALRPDLLGRDRSWFVFSTGAVGGLVVLALADNTVRLQFAAPASFASSYVYLPFLFAAFGLMISRSFVRSMPVSFRRADWLVYTVRAMEFSALLHAAAVLWHLLAAITGTAGITLGGPVLHLVDAAVCACFGHWSSKESDGYGKAVGAGGRMRQARRIDGGRLMASVMRRSTWRTSGPRKRPARFTNASVFSPVARYEYCGARPLELSSPLEARTRYTSWAVSTSLDTRRTPGPST